MPELAELKLMSDFINSCCQDKKVKSIRTNPKVNKLEHINEHDLDHVLTAESRGKELRLNIGQRQLYMTMGMTGNWMRKKSTDSFDKHDRLVFDLDDGQSLIFTDYRRFGKWKFDTKWAENRGPCPVVDHLEFVDHIYELYKSRSSKNQKPLHLILLDQQYFNGIGNYLRAEIIGSEGLDPWMSISDLSEPRLVSLLKSCKDTPLFYYELGGGKISTFSDPNQLDYEGSNKTAFKFYKNDKICTPFKDRSGRTFWADRSFVESFGINNVKMNKYERCIDSLERTGKGSMKCFGNSMKSKIESGSVINFERRDQYEVGDIVFCKVKGRYIDAHYITKKDGDRYMIANESGHENGWCRKIYAKAVSVEKDQGPEAL